MRPIDIELLIWIVPFAYGIIATIILAIGDFIHWLRTGEHLRN